MKIILLEDVANLGKIGSIVDVKNGFARNFLVPFGRAKRATKENIATFEATRADYEAKQDQKLATAKARFDQIHEKVFTITAKSGVDGKLFGSVTSFDIAEAVRASGIELQKAEVAMPDGPLKTIGEFEVTVLLHHDVHALVKISVTPES